MACARARVCMAAVERLPCTREPLALSLACSCAGAWRCRMAAAAGCERGSNEQVTLSDGLELHHRTTALTAAWQPAHALRQPCIGLSCMVSSCGCIHDMNQSHATNHGKCCMYICAPHHHHAQHTIFASSTLGQHARLSYTALACVSASRHHHSRSSSCCCCSGLPLLRLKCGIPG